MIAAASALMILFAGDNLDNWIVLSGRWDVRDGAMVCLSGPASIRSTYESDDFTLRFQYRHSGKGENRLFVHSKMATGGEPLRITPSGLLTVGGGAATPFPDDAWIGATVSVAGGGLEAVSGVSGGTTAPGGSLVIMKAVGTVPRGSRGFVRFETSEPGLEIRNVSVEESGFRNMFDGHSLAGWEIVRPGNRNSPGWTVTKGTVCCRGAGSGWLRTLETYDNYVLRLEYQLPTRGNSGIYVRAPLEGRVSRIGMEIQLLDDAAFRDRFRVAQFAGSVYDAIAPEVQVPVPANQWNAIEVLLEGKRVRTVLNGTQIYDASLDDAAKDVNSAKRPLSTRHLEGFIGFQEHTTPVSFRNVRLKSLPGRPIVSTRPG